MNKLLGVRGVVVEFWGFSPYIEDTVNKICSDKLSTQKPGSHRWKSSSSFVLDRKMKKMP